MRNSDCSRDEYLITTMAHRMFFSSDIAFAAHGINPLRRSNKYGGSASVTQMGRVNRSDELSLLINSAHHTLYSAIDPRMIAKIVGSLKQTLIHLSWAAKWTKNEDDLSLIMRLLVMTATILTPCK